MNTAPSLVVLDGKTLFLPRDAWDEIASLGSLTFHDDTPRDQVVERAKDADIILTNKVRITEETLAGLPRCRLVTVLATGYDVVDIAACGKRGIPVCNVPGYGAESVAEFAIAQLLALVRGVELHDRLVRAGEWNKRGHFSFWDTPQVELKGLTLGVVGFGAIGRRMAELGLGFGMRALAYTPRPKEPIASPNFAFVPLDDLFRQSNVISLHCPLTDTNREFANQRLLSLMPPGGYFLNTARGKLVNEADLAQALNSGHLAGVALDVLAHEPPRADNPLLTAQNCLITPHMAWGSLTARMRLMAIAADNIRQFLAGWPNNVVNARYLK